VDALSLVGGLLINNPASELGSVSRKFSECERVRASFYHGDCQWMEETGGHAILMPRFRLVFPAKISIRTFYTAPQKTAQHRENTRKNSFLN
jgi:hypothetical protein